MTCSSAALQIATNSKSIKNPMQNANSLQIARAMFRNAEALAPENSEPNLHPLCGIAGY